MSYRSTLRADALKPVAGKLQISLGVGGGEAETVEEAFAIARDAEAQERRMLPHFLLHNAKPAAPSRRCLRPIRQSSLLPIYRAEIGGSLANQHGPPPPWGRIPT